MEKEGVVLRGGGRGGEGKAEMTPSILTFHFKRFPKYRTYLPPLIMFLLLFISISLHHIYRGIAITEEQCTRYHRQSLGL